MIFLILVSMIAKFSIEYVKLDLEREKYKRISIMYEAFLPEKMRTAVTLEEIMVKYEKNGKGVFDVYTEFFRRYKDDIPEGYLYEPFVDEYDAWMWKDLLLP
ncbi:hypothetical protein [Enterococcus sp. LJL51]|uniref:hypothetical protein n=1 Tax=Enterococcus sp. LJL51 TaxID=3416656 RepID=UPI003CF1CD2E